MSIAALLTVLSGSASVAACMASSCNFEALAPYFAKLALPRDAREAAPIHILQIGDSHSAGDAVTGAWRALLQGRFGDGGRGVLAPGRPYDGYITHDITASMSAGWSIGATFGKDAHEPRPLLGLTGFSLTSTRAGAGMALNAAPGRVFDRFVLCAIGGPAMPGVTIRFDRGPAVQLDFIAAERQSICRTIGATGEHASVEIVADGPSLTITSWAVFQDDGGVAISNLGVVGSQLAHFARTDDGVVTEELKAYRPDLIVLAFGTNEGFSPHFDPVGYEALLRAQITRLRRLSNGVPMLLLGAPAALSRLGALRTNADAAPVACEPTRAVRDMPPTDAPSMPAQTALFAPPALAMVRAIQRRVAGELGLAFWDWNARMGGACTPRDWSQRPVPLMRGDHVHFTTAGGLEIAHRLQADLDKGAALAE